MGTNLKKMLGSTTHPTLLSTEAKERGQQEDYMPINVIGEFVQWMDYTKYRNWGSYDISFYRGSFSSNTIYE